MPRYSVVIPTYNSARFVGETLDSVLRQRDADLELIVIDDGSRDETPALVERCADPRIRFLRQPNAGGARARNRGFALCRGEMVLFLDADDRLHPTALARLGHALAQDPGATLAYGNAARIDPAGRRLDRDGAPWFSPRPGGDVLATLLVHNFIRCPGAALVRADALRRRGAFKPQVVPGADWELWCRMAAAGRFVFVAAEPVVEYRVHAASMTATQRLDAARLWPPIEEVYSLPEIVARFPPRRLRRLRRRREAASYARLAAECLRHGDWQPARRFLLQSLRRRPRSPRNLALLAFGALRWCPAWLRQRL